MPDGGLTSAPPSPACSTYKNKRDIREEKRGQAKRVLEWQTEMEAPSEGHRSIVKCHAFL